MTSSQYKSGYTLLFAVLTAALVLGVAVFILSISRKQYDLAVQARESMYSFYAADSAMECIAMADRNANLNLTDPNTFYCDSSLTPITLNDGTLGNTYVVTDTAPGFKQNAKQLANKPILFINGQCALVTITTGNDANDNTEKTTIETRGYNNCDSSGQPIQSTRTVERALRLTKPFVLR